MAEMMDQGGGAHGKKGGPKAKKKSTRIDMTAMVDVAFLLLTFFVLTSTMAKPSMMVLSVPPKRPDDTSSTKIEMKESKFLTLILGKKDKVHYYFGISEAEVKTTNYGVEGVRKLIRMHLDKGKAKGLPLCEGKETKGCWDPIIVIKPNKTSRYKNLIDILDEMKISAVPKYALTEMTPNDSTLLVQFGKE